MAVRLTDDEMEIIETQGGGVASLKCPITGRLFADPVKNKVCGHIYSREGIDAHMRNAHRRAATCPVAGCNKPIQSSAQLEKDVETEMKVRRQQRKEDYESQQRASQASDLVDSDEE